MPKSPETSLSKKEWYNKPTKLQSQSIFIQKSVVISKGYESNKIYSRTWIRVTSGSPWPTRSDTHQVVEI